MGLKKMYDKTNFFNHMGKVKSIANIFTSLSKIHDSFLTHEGDIEVTTDMGVHLKADIERAEGLGNKAAANSLHHDFDRNETLIEEHRADRRKTIKNFIKELDRLGFPKSAG